MNEVERAALERMVQDRLGMTLSAGELETLGEGYRLLLTMLAEVDDDVPPALAPSGHFTVIRS
jgi:hypothetical protein